MGSDDEKEVEVGKAMEEALAGSEKGEEEEEEEEEWVEEPLDDLQVKTLFRKGNKLFMIGAVTSIAAALLARVSIIAAVTCLPVMLCLMMCLWPLFPCVFVLSVCLAALFLAGDSLLSIVGLAGGIVAIMGALKGRKAANLMVNRTEAPDCITWHTASICNLVSLVATPFAVVAHLVESSVWGPWGNLAMFVMVIPLLCAFDWSVNAIGIVPCIGICARVVCIYVELFVSVILIYWTLYMILPMFFFYAPLNSTCLMVVIAVVFCFNGLTIFKNMSTAKFFEIDAEIAENAVFAEEEGSQHSGSVHSGKGEDTQV